MCDVVYSVNGESIIKTFRPRQHELFMAAWFRCVPSEIRCVL